MKTNGRSRGFTLLLVIALIPLLGMAGMVMTSNSRQIMTQTRRNAVRLHAQLACESGIVWLQGRPLDVHAKNKPLVLEIEQQGTTVTCTIERISQTADQTIYTVIGAARDKRFSCTYSRQFIQKHINNTGV